VGGACRTQRRYKNTCILAGNPEQKRPYGIIWHIWEESIKIYFWGKGWEVVHSIHVAQDRDQRRILAKTGYINSG